LTFDTKKSQFFNPFQPMLSGSISIKIHPAFTSVTAVTVADLGAWCSSARSPKKSPRGKGTMERVKRRTWMGNSMISIDFSYFSK
jgi:hypothetical protein